MEFINRAFELKELENAYKLSRKRLFPILITGPRRIGKTRLIEEFCKKKKFLYFFVYEGKGANSLLREFEKELKDKKIIDQYRTVSSVEEFIEIIFSQCRGWVVVFDEVQYMRSIYKPFFSLMQRKIDENQDYPTMIVFLGSVVGLVKRVFEDLKSPLYGRMKQKISLNQLSYKAIRKMMYKLDYLDEEDYACFYCIFGGFPKYYVTMEDYNLQKNSLLNALGFLFFRENAPLKNEVVDMLRQEFGKGKSYYYDIIEAIALGKTKLSEIASYTGKHQTDITPFMKDLMDYYEIIKRETIITEDPKKSRTSIYIIKSPLFRFWFKFVYPNLRYIESGKFDLVLDNIKKEINSYTGLGFEEICKQIIEEINKSYLVGKWWGYQRRDGKREEIEIDIVALNEKNKEVLFGECKWKEKANAENIVKKLVEKSKHINWNNEERKESYAVFAKSFSKKIDKFEGSKVYCYDLNDIGKIIKH